MRAITGALFATTILAISGCSTTAENPNYQQITKYKGSTPYVNGQPVQPANYETQAAAPVTYVQQFGKTRAYQECISKESNRKIIGTAAGGVVGGLVGRKVADDHKTLGTVAGAAIGGAAGYGIADKTINCDPVQAPATIRQTAPTYQAVPQAVTYEAPKEEQGLIENTQSLGENGTPGYYAVNGIEPPAPEVQQVEPQLAQIQPIQPEQVQPEPVPVPTTFTAKPQPAGTIRHTVIPGDTLYSLARTTCSSVAEIQQMNSINAEFYIRAGDNILLPSGRCAE